MDIKKQAIFKFIDDHKTDMVTLWQELVSIESGSPDKAGVDAVADRICKELRTAGGQTRIIPMKEAGNLLVGAFNADSRQDAVLFLGHMDTVFPKGTLAERPFTIRDGIAYGPGVLDMKGGIVAAVYAMKALHSAGYTTRPLKIVLAGDEEVAHAHSNAGEILLSELHGIAAFNCETGFTDDAIVTGRKGTLRFDLSVQGIAVHAGNEPENGRSAILEIAHKVIAIQNLTDWEKGTTFNVGVIAGGTVPNAVPGQATIKVDIRYLDPELLPKIRQQMQDVAASQYVPDTVTTLTECPGMIPMPTTDGVSALFDIVSQTYAEMGLNTPYSKRVGGGSDSAFSVKAGVPTVCAMGVKGGRNHSPEEFAIVDSLFERAKLLAACTLNLDNKH